MIELIFNFVPAVLTVSVLYLTYLMSKIMMDGGFKAPLLFCDVYIKTYGLNHFISLLVRSFLIAGSVLNAFGRVSNHVIITLDILYLLSILMIYLFQVLRFYEYPSDKKI